VALSCQEGKTEGGREEDDGGKGDTSCHGQVTMSFSHLSFEVSRQGYFPNRKLTRHLN